jgi:hypothetical protein
LTATRAAWRNQAGEIKSVSAADATYKRFASSSSQPSSLTDSSSVSASASASSSRSLSSIHRELLELQQSLMEQQLSEPKDNDDGDESKTSDDKGRTTATHAEGRSDFVLMLSSFDH